MLEHSSQREEQTLLLLLLLLVQGFSSFWNNQNGTVNGAHTHTAKRKSAALALFISARRQSVSVLDSVGAAAAEVATNGKCLSVSICCVGERERAEAAETFPMQKRKVM